MTFEDEFKELYNNGDDWSESALFYAQDVKELIVKNTISKVRVREAIEKRKLNAVKENNDDKLSKIQKAVYKKVADMTIPGFVKQPAGWLDTKEKGIHPTLKPIQRTPRTTEKGIYGEVDKFWQQIELGIPVLRKNVPKSKYSGITKVKR